MLSFRGNFQGDLTMHHTLLTSLALGLLLGFATLTPASAAPACKTEADGAACKARADCVWVPSYVQKASGKPVKAYCRVKAVKAKS